METKLLNYKYKAGRLTLFCRFATAEQWPAVSDTLLFDNRKFFHSANIQNLGLP